MSTLSFQKLAFALLYFCFLWAVVNGVTIGSSIDHDNASKNQHLQTRRPGFLLPNSNSNFKTHECQPFETTFSDPSDVSHTDKVSSSTPFVAISPTGSYSIVEGSGLELYLDRPEGKIHRKDKVNDKVAEGATINSTFVFLHGKVTMELSAPQIPGAVTAAILIADSRDEIDVELLGGDPHHWQTNVFAYTHADKEPLWGVFGEVEDYSKTSDEVDEIHSYTIDWNESRIVWSVDGVVARTLEKEDTEKNGGFHFPSHLSRIQLGIWDASNPAGTSEWAKGPIDWDKVPKRTKAVFKSIKLECPNN
ncbi:glycosyl hydrolases family 16-domain-containing protein [Abortiporus biennis]|nr:glycosyl hydrolases family 16-domain-containing protein [Abortiporus biennis]